MNKSSIFDFSSNFFKFNKIFLASILVIFLTACAAPLVLMGAASLGGTFKAVQSITGGNVEVIIDTQAITSAQRAKFRQVRRLAVWPDATQVSVLFAEELDGKNGFQIITPSKVSQTIQTRRLNENLSQMTKLEASQTMNTICQDTNAQGVIFARPTGGGQNTNFFSFDRANVTRTYAIIIHAARDQEAFMQFPATLKINVGGTRPSEFELISIMAKEVAAALVQI